MKQTLKVRPIFLHNDDRVYALLSIVGSACSSSAWSRPGPCALARPQLPGLLPKAAQQDQPPQHPRASKDSA